ncbi:MAG: hypothetical protein TU36_006935 [Vulcanisaeta sp. AZ3]|jgi:ribosomal protein S27AE
MRIRLNLECPRCGGALLLEECRGRVSVVCGRCGLKVSWRLHEAARKALKITGDTLLFDWNSVIDELYLELAMNTH